MTKLKGYFSKGEINLWSASVTFSYYGEMITYLGMTMPMAIFALISWLKNPYNGNKAEVKVNSIGKRENVCMWIGTFVITFIFYFILSILTQLI